MNITARKNSRPFSLPHNVCLQDLTLFPPLPRNEVTEDQPSGCPYLVFFVDASRVWKRLATYGTNSLGGSSLVPGPVRT